MSMVFQFRMLSDENDRFVRDYETPCDMTLLDFHRFILHSLEYEECVASFFTADKYWERLREFTLIDMRGGTDEGPEPMEGVTLQQVVQNNGYRLIYLFDLFGDRAYYLQLTASCEAILGVTYPREIFATENAPDQYDPTKNIDSGDDSAFEDMMSDFGEFTADDHDGYA